MKERWVWSCNYDQGSGKDRALCRAGSRTPVKSKQLAQRQLDKHLNGGCSFNLSNLGIQATVFQLKKYQRWYK
jgi:hypothetical protein